MVQTELRGTRRVSIWQIARLLSCNPRTPLMLFFLSLATQWRRKVGKSYSAFPLGSSVVRSILARSVVWSILATAKVFCTKWEMWDGYLAPTNPPTKCLLTILFHWVGRALRKWRNTFLKTSRFPSEKKFGCWSQTHLIIVTTPTTWGGVPFSSWRTFFHRERDRNCF